MTPAARDLDLRQHHGVETPEHVDVRLELAGVGSRLAAAMLDTFLMWIGLILLFVIASAIFAGGRPGDVAAGWAGAIVILLMFALAWGYFTLFEALNGGRTPGKQALGIRVVMDTGRPVTGGAAVIRNLVRLLDCYFPFAPVLPALVLMFLHRSNKRLGDIAAGTIVVRDRPTAWAIGAAVPAAPVPAVELGPPELSDEEFRLLDRFVARHSELAPEVQVRLAYELAKRFEPRIPRRGGDVQAYLVEVLASEQEKRRGRFGVRARPVREGAGAPGSAPAPGRITVTGERFVAGKREAWEAFRLLAVRMERAGVGALGEAEIPKFAAQYREVAADLARARTYQVDARVIEYLERVVSAGHNALYRARGRAGTPVVRYLLREFPAAVVQSWRYVVVALLMFAVPALAGYAMLRDQPALADELVPPIMISRAEEAAARQAEGRGYVEAGDADRPWIAAQIMTHNIQVSFGVFVGGLTGGLLSAWLLFFNGMLLGLVFGLFQNYGAATYLTTFIVAHGVLELVAIFISAGAGFRLAKALIAPGDRTRRDALVVEGGIAARMIGAVVLLLVIAGTIEGLLSASAAAPAWKYGVSAATAVLLVLYLVSGWTYLRESGAGSSVVMVPPRSPNP
ncbi:MAG: stage II sporulation protein M [Gemmatimonadales bacterium]